MTRHECRSCGAPIDPIPFEDKDNVDTGRCGFCYRRLDRDELWVTATPEQYAELMYSQAPFTRMFTAAMGAAVYVYRGVRVEVQVTGS